VSGFPVSISGRLLTTLQRSHRVHVTLAVIAHDGARHQQGKSTRTRLTLVLKA
jgi:hypothetical protein